MHSCRGYWAIENHSFESRTLTPWSFESVAGSSYDTTLYSSRIYASARTGSRALRFAWLNAAGTGRVGGRLQAFIPVLPNSAYQMYAYHRLEYDASVTGTCTVTWSLNGSPVQTVEVSSVSSWTEVKARFQLGEVTSARFVVQVDCDAGITMWVDDVMLMRDCTGECGFQK